MARYIGPVCKLCRREGEKLFLKGERCFTPKCSFERRGYAPGQHGVLQVGAVLDAQVAGRKRAANSRETANRNRVVTVAGNRTVKGALDDQFLVNGQSTFHHHRMANQRRRSPFRAGRALGRRCGRIPERIFAGSIRSGHRRLAGRLGRAL